MLPSTTLHMFDVGLYYVCVYDVEAVEDKKAYYTDSVSPFAM